MIRTFLSRAATFLGGQIKKWLLFCGKLENYFLETRVPLFFLGDFNNPVDSQGYYTVRESCLLLQDSYVVTNEKGKAATVEKKIDGWEQNTEKLRIDFIFVPEGMQVKKYQRIFDGIDSPIISDHYGWKSN